MTLQEAHTATGIPVNTLRKWARRGYVDSHVIDTEDGMRRMVRFDTVLRHAAEVDREVAPIESKPAPPPPPPETAKIVGPSEAGHPVAARSEPEGMPAAGEETPAVETPPPGTMIVPIDAWNKMLLQLGNLHEAGQQLAEARERAAKAETEAAFLRERLAEWRAERSEPAAALAAPPPAEPSRGGETAAETAGAPGPRPDGTIEPWWVYARRRWRERRRRT